MTKQITVGYDGTESSMQAVLWAADEAAMRGTPLRIISTYNVAIGAESVAGFSATQAIAVLMEATNQRLHAARALVTSLHPALEAVTEAVFGSASDVLAHGSDADDLVVVGASEHQGAAAFWLGSTPRHLVRHSPCPVVVVRGPATQGRPDRVVVGVDGSADSDRALLWAGAAAERHQVGLLVVHSWEFPYQPTDTASSQARDIAQIEGGRVLEIAVERAQEQFNADVSSKLVEGNPIAAVLDELRDGDLLVLGSHGRGALMAGLLGSTVNGVLDHAAVPVVVVRGEPIT